MQACHPSQVTAYQQELPTVFTSPASRLRGAAKLIPGAATYHWTLLSRLAGLGRCDTARRAAWRRGLDGWSVIAARSSGVLAGPFLAAGACFSNQAEGIGEAEANVAGGTLDQPRGEGAGLLVVAVVDLRWSCRGGSAGCGLRTGLGVL
jgi:hypothetical protein